MAEKRAFVLVKGGNALHVVIGKGKIEHVEIFRHPLLVDGLWNHHNSALQMPPEHNLRRGFSVLFANRKNRLVLKKSAVPLAERCPRLKLNAVLVVPLFLPRPAD